MENKKIPDLPSIDVMIQSDFINNIDIMMDSIVSLINRFDKIQSWFDDYKKKTGVNFPLKKRNMALYRYDFGKLVAGHEYNPCIVKIDEKIYLTTFKHYDFRDTRISFYIDNEKKVFVKDPFAVPFIFDVNSIPTIPEIKTSGKLDFKTRQKIKKNKEDISKREWLISISKNFKFDKEISTSDLEDLDNALSQVVRDIQIMAEESIVEKNRLLKIAGKEKETGLNIDELDDQFKAWNEEKSKI